MLPYSTLTILLASADPALLATLEPMLAADGATVQVVLSAEAALAALNAAPAPALVLIDATLPAMSPQTNLVQLLAITRVESSARRGPIVLISDTLAEEWIGLLAEGIIDDLHPRTSDPALLRFRLAAVLRDYRRVRELETLRETTALNAQIDHLTGVYNRETMLSMLFRETDRVQRMKSPLCVILFDIDDFGHWNSRLGTEACDELLCQVASRATRLLRSYDLLGRPGKDEFLMALPGCSSVNAVLMAERLRVDVFSAPFRVGGDAIRLSACFGVASSLGRSPVVVLREAEQALLIAKATGPESIQCAGDFPEPSAAPVAFLSSTSDDELLAW
jgi:diguanylate cyclase (GGDEF)-like protein